MMISSRLFIALSAVLIGSICFDGIVEAQDSSDQNKSSGLPRGTTRLLDEVIVPAYLGGWTDVFYSELYPLVEKMNSDQLLALEAYGQTLGIGSIQRAFVNIMVQPAEQGLTWRAPNVSQTMTTYVASGVAARVQDELEAIAEEHIMQDPLTLPDGWRESEMVFWKSHVLKNRFDVLHRLTEYGQVIAAPHLKRARKNGDAAAVAQLEKAEQAVVTVTRMNRDLIEREAELRLLELERAESTFRTSEDFEERLNAAFALENHGLELELLFREHSPEEFERERLRDTAGLERAAQQFANGRKLGQHEIERACLLRIGTHWWLRGRYGVAPLANGLLKNPDAMNSDQAMFGLYMPQDLPQPISTAFEGEEKSPGYDRRHYYTWAVEYRPRIIQSTTDSYTAKSPLSDAKYTGNYFW